MQSLRRRPAVASCIAFTLSILIVQTANSQAKLLVDTQRDQTFRIYNADTLEQISATKEDAGNDAGHEVAATLDGKLAFVPLYGDAGVGRTGSDGDRIEVFDVTTGKSIGDIKFVHGVRPHKPIWDPKTGMLLVSTEIDKTISIIDSKSMKVVGSIPTGAEQSHMITLLPDGRKLYSANVGPGTVSVMDVPGRKLLKTIPISATTQRISSSVDGKYVFTADQVKPELAVIDTSKDEVVKSIALPDVGYGTAPTPDGKYLLVCMDKQPAIVVVDLKTMEVTKKIITPTGIDEVLVTPDGKLAYASSARTDHLVKINLETWSVTKDVRTGKFPDGIWYIPAK